MIIDSESMLPGGLSVSFKLLIIHFKTQYFYEWKPIIIPNANPKSFLGYIYQKQKYTIRLHALCNFFVLFIIKKRLLS